MTEPGPFVAPVPPPGPPSLIARIPPIPFAIAALAMVFVLYQLVGGEEFVSAAFRAGYRADNLRVRQRYARLAEPWKASRFPLILRLGGSLPLPG